LSNEYKEYWDNHYKTYGPLLGVTHLTPQGYYDHYRYFFERWYGQKEIKSILDYGCGTSMLVPLLTDLLPEAKYTGADISAVAIEEAKKKYPEIEYFDLTETKPTGKYDLVICHSVFTHIFLDDALALLKRLNSLMNIGSIMSVSIHNDTNRDIIGNIPRIDIRTKFFTDLLEQHGFSITDQYEKIQCYFNVTKVKECE
jgi:trans-aconitate methyltransferase